MNSQPIHLTEWGQVGPTVVMVHGGVQGSRVGGVRNFQGQESLADLGWRLIIPDRPGHGQSAAPGRPDDAEADGAWVVELLGDGGHLVGHSFGGCVALAAAAARPDLVKSLTLIEPAMHSLAADDPRVRPFLTGMMRAILLTFSPQRRAQKVMNLLGIPSQMRDPDSDELKRMGRNFVRFRPPAKAVLQRQLDVVKKAAIPSLVVTGGWNAAFEVTADRVAAVINGRHIVVPCPHHFPQSNSEIFNPILNDFLTASEAVQRNYGSCDSFGRD